MQWDEEEKRNEGHAVSFSFFFFFFFLFLLFHSHEDGDRSFAHTLDCSSMIMMLMVNQFVIPLSLAKGDNYTKKSPSYPSPLLSSAWAKLQLKQKDFWQ